MLIDHISVGVPHRRVIVRVTVWLGPLIAAVLMLVMRPVSMHVQVINGRVLVLQIFSAVFGPEHRRKGCKHDTHLQFGRAVPVRRLGSSPAPPSWQRRLPRVNP